ncbi:MAG: hypothetical protein ACKV22_26525 [Bryobacteraceae bacterium]
MRSHDNRFPRGIAGSDSQRLHTAPFTGRTPLVVDSTRVGAAVVEMLRHTALPLVPVILTGANTSTTPTATHPRAQTGCGHRARRASGAAEWPADEELALLQGFLRETETFQGRPLP